MESLKLMLLGTGLLILSACGPQAQKESEGTVTEKSNLDAVIETIMSRHNIRKYKPEAVNRDTMKIVPDCGINAPNGQDKRSWAAHVVDSPEFLNEVNEVFKQKNPQVAGGPNFKSIFRSAPTMVFIGNDISYDCSQIDCGLLDESMVLAAWSMGIGSCCLANPTRFIAGTLEITEYLKRLKFSEGHELLYCVVFDYPDEAPTTKPKDTTRVKYID